MTLKKAKKAAEQAAEQAVEQGSTLEDVVDCVIPRAMQAKDQAASFVSDARDRVAPLVSDVTQRVPPAVREAYDTVSDKVQYDVYPRLQDMWEDASEDPRVVEATRRSKSALAALKGDLLLPEVVVVPRRRRRRIVGRIFTVLGIAALVGVVAVVVRAVLGSSDDGWSPAEPLRAEDDAAEWGENPFADTTDAEEQMPSGGGALAAEEVPGDGSVGDDSGAAASAPEYGEGAYVGAEPPEGYTIKGNERSMKYHTVEAAGYERTNADVWFNSEEAAQAAGFTRALR